MMSGELATRPLARCANEVSSGLMAGHASSSRHRLMTAWHDTVLRRAGRRVTSSSCARDQCRQVKYERCGSQGDKVDRCGSQGDKVDRTRFVLVHDDSLQRAAGLGLQVRDDVVAGRHHATTIWHV